MELDSFQRKNYFREYISTSSTGTQLKQASNDTEAQISQAGTVLLKSVAFPGYTLQLPLHNYLCRHRMKQIRQFKSKVTFQSSQTVP